MCPKSPPLKHYAPAKRRLIGASLRASTKWFSSRGSRHGANAQASRQTLGANAALNPTRFRRSAPDKQILANIGRNRPQRLFPFQKWQARLRCRRSSAAQTITLLGKNARRISAEHCCTSGIPSDQSPRILGRAPKKEIQADEHLRRRHRRLGHQARQTAGASPSAFSRKSARPVNLARRKSPITATELPDGVELSCGSLVRADERFVASAGEEEATLCWVPKLVDHDFGQARGVLNPRWCRNPSRKPKSGHR